MRAAIGRMKSMDSTLIKDDVNDGVKEGVDQETVDAVREVGGAYKYGWSTDIEMDYAPLGPRISVG